MTLCVNVRADLYRTIMRINPEDYKSLCIHLRCRGFPSHFAKFACPPPPTGLGRSTLTRCGGTPEGDGGMVPWWESILLVNAGTSQTPITVSASKADVFIRLSYKEIYVPRE